MGARGSQGAPLGSLGGRGEGGARASMASSGCWSSGHGGGVAPVKIGRGRGVCELREVEAKLLAGSLGAERVWNGGFTAGLSSPAFSGRWWCSGMWRRRKSVGTRGIECGVVPGSDAHAR